MKNPAIVHGFDHMRFNATEYVVLNYLPREPERCSSKFKWAFSVDTGLDYSNNRVTVLDPPNENIGELNEVLLNKNLKSLSITLPPPSVTNAFTLNNNDKKLRIGQLTEVVITGKNLVGNFFLKKQHGTHIVHKYVRIKETDPARHFDDGTEVRVTFDIPNNYCPSSGWEIFVENSGGASKPIGGFELIKP